MSRFTKSGKSITFILLLTLTFLAVLPAPAAATSLYSGGSGTAADPYLISTKSDWTQLMSDTADWNKCFSLTADINFGGATLTPVGNGTTQFSGTFNGNGHVLSNASIGNSNLNYQGVFGYTNQGSQISDLGVENINVSGEYDTGGLVGSNFGKISGCYTTGNVTATNSFEAGDVGGLVGYNNQGSITDSYATGTIIYSGDEMMMGGQIGGLVGEDNAGTIQRCYATGDVTGNNTNMGGWEIGGLVGFQIGGSIQDSYATGAVNGEDDIGGLAGFISSTTVTDCYSTGAVTGSYDLGGLVAGIYSSTASSSYWNTQTSGQSSSGAGTGCTTSEMTYPYATNTYVGWDFSGTWTADSGGLNNGYPYLQLSAVTAVAKMSVEGNSLEIASGDSTPSSTDYTDFGQVDVSGSIKHTFSIQNTGSGPLILSGSPEVVIGGTNAGDFSVTQQPSSPVAAVSGNTTFQVAFSPSAAGLRTATISIANNDPGNNPYTFAIQGTGTGELTVSGITANNKTYDGTKVATLNTGNAVLVGVNGNDNVTLDVSGAAGAFSNKDVGNGKSVTVSGLTISGNNSADYTLVQPMVTANITARELMVSGITANNKTYDGTKAATLNTGNTTLVGVVTGDDVELDVSGATGSFDNARVGTDKTVTVSGLTISGADAGNYTLTQPTTTADILAPENNVQVIPSVPNPPPTPEPTPTPTLTPTPTPTSSLLATPNTLEVNIEDQTANADISQSGVVEGTVNVSSPDGKLVLTIPDGTTVLTGDNAIPQELSITPDENPPSPPKDENIIGIPYICLPGGTTFSPAITLTWSYDPASLPQGTDQNNLEVAFYNEASGQWEAVKGVIDTNSHTITAGIPHFTVYALISPAVPTAPAVVTSTPVPQSTQAAMPAPETTVAVTTPASVASATTGSTFSLGLLAEIIGGVVVVLLMVLLYIRRKKGSLNL